MIDHHRAQAQWELNLSFNFYLSIHLNWLSNQKLTRCSNARENKRKVHIKMRSSRSHCAWRTFEKRWHESTSCLFWRTKLATQQRQYRVCDAKIVHPSFCDALYHHRNGIAIQVWWKIICRRFFLFFVLSHCRRFYTKRDATAEIAAHAIHYVPNTGIAIDRRYTHSHTSIVTHTAYSVLM